MVQKEFQDSAESVGGEKGERNRRKEEENEKGEERSRRTELFFGLDISGHASRLDFLS